MCAEKGSTVAKDQGTPLMRQYNEVKANYSDAIVLFRMGDFYETFSEDAKTTAKILGIVLTKRANGAAADVPLAGFPYHALVNYLHKLVNAGHRVAICEQVEDPKLAKGEHEFSGALDDANLALFREACQAAGQTIDDLVLPCPQTAGVDLRWPEFQAAVGHLLGLLDDLGRVQQRLGRNAADIQTDAAERRVALDQDYVQAEVGRADEAHLDLRHLARIDQSRRRRPRG